MIQLSGQQNSVESHFGFQEPPFGVRMRLREPTGGLAINLDAGAGWARRPLQRHAGVRAGR